jgi:hypothetical protein
VIKGVKILVILCSVPTFVILTTGCGSNHQQPIIPNWNEVQHGSLIKSINFTNAQWEYENFSYYDVHAPYANFARVSQTPTSIGLFDGNSSTYDLKHIVPGNIYCYFSSDENVDLFCSSTIEEISWSQSFVSSTGSLTWNQKTHTVTFETPILISGIMTIPPEDYSGFFNVARFELV